MKESGTICDMAQSEIDALTADGIVLTPAEIVKINALAWAATDPETRMYLSRGVPVSVGGAKLWPFTLCGSEWFQRVGLKMEPQHVITQALAFALAFGRSPGSELECDGDEAKRAVEKWAAGIRATQAELEEAVSQVLMQDGENSETFIDPDAEAMGSGEMSAYLMAAGGGTIEMWERQCSIGYIAAYMAALARQGKEDGKPTLADPKVRGVRALGLYVEHIRADRREQNADG